MNIRLLFSVPALALIALSNPLHAADHVDAPESYHYGMHLDVAQVIAIDAPNPATCQVVDAQMTYRTSNGEVKRLSYAKMAEACAEQN